MTDSARIITNTQSETGNRANINLQIANNITLRNNSFISAQALGNADGGNLIIDTNSIIAFPNQNNDIIASAEDGNGGNINITAKSLLGLEERPLSSVTNDINASSEFGLTGNVSITNPDVAPLQGATELPSDVVEPEQTTAQACAANRENIAQNGLSIKGRGVFHQYLQSL